MTVLHTGSTEKFASGWESVFGRGSKTKSGPKKSAAKAAAGRKPAKKRAAPKKKGKR